MQLRGNYPCIPSFPKGNCLSRCALSRGTASPRPARTQHKHDSERRRQISASTVVSAIISPFFRLQLLHIAWIAINAGHLSPHNSEAKPAGEVPTPRVKVRSAQPQTQPPGQSNAPTKLKRKHACEHARYLQNTVHEHKQPSSTQPKPRHHVEVQVEVKGGVPKPTSKSKSKSTTVNQSESQPKPTTKVTVNFKVKSHRQRHRHRRSKSNRGRQRKSQIPIQSHCQKSTIERQLQPTTANQTQPNSTTQRPSSEVN